MSHKKPSEILHKHLNKLYDGFNIMMLGRHSGRIRSFILDLQKDLEKYEEKEKGNPLQTGKDFIDEMEVPENVQRWIDKQKSPINTDESIIVNHRIQHVAESLWRMMYRQLFSAQQTARINHECSAERIKELEKQISDLKDWIHSHM